MSALLSHSRLSLPAQGTITVNSQRMSSLILPSTATKVVGISSSAASLRALLPPLRATYTNEADNLYKGLPLQEGLINKRLMEKQMKKENKEFMSAMKLAENDTEKEILFRRESRTPPTNNEELVEYFLNTMAEDMEFEVSRKRPMLDGSFFRHMDNIIGALRFSPEGEKDEDGLAELEGLRQYLVQACQVVDQAVSKVSSAKDRITKLLTSRDKKELILQMAENNEIDHAFMIALTQNIQDARAAEQEDAAKFMEKVQQACAKYYVAPTSSAAPLVPPSGASAAGGPAAQAAGALELNVADIAAAARQRAAERATANGIIIPGVMPTAPSSMPGRNASPPSKGPGGGSGLIIPGR